ncbi:homologous-pairing protein 2 homolog [Curcuma longa]|uniref:homologous-pairing protein 2 homolog n=1 Tax=Curcuma longa TaxID=136217 RepID=UPI003D9F44AB
MKEDIRNLQDALGIQKKATTEVEAEIKALQSNLTLEEIRAKEAELLSEVDEMGSKLSKLHSGVVLVKPEDKKLIEDTYIEKINHWRKRKRMFKELWDAITENSPKDLKEFKEELGLEYDEDIGVSLQTYGELVNHSKKRKIAR